MNPKPRVKQLNKRFGTTGFFLTTEFNRHFVAIKKELIGKSTLNLLRKDYCVIPMNFGYYYICEKDEQLTIKNKRIKNVLQSRF